MHPSEHLKKSRNLDAFFEQNEKQDKAIKAYQHIEMRILDDHSAFSFRLIYLSQQYLQHLSDDIFALDVYKSISRGPSPKCVK